MDIEWTDTDPDTGGRRYVCAEKFARKWRFKVRLHRRAVWDRSAPVTREMLETLLDALERRYRRREGVSDEDLAHARKLLADYRDPPSVAEEDGRNEAQKDAKNEDTGQV